MRLTLITPPAAEPISTDDLKDFVRVDHDDEDGTLAAVITAARQTLDGRDGLLGRALVTQTWRLTLDAFPRVVTVPLPPLQAVTAITYLDVAGDEQTLAEEAYFVEGIGDPDPATIRPAKGSAWPSTWDMPGAVAITFRAGYGDAEAVPEPLRQAIRMHAAHLYEQREATAPDALRIVPLGYDEAVTPYRLWSV